MFLQTMFILHRATHWIQLGINITSIIFFTLNTFCPRNHSVTAWTYGTAKRFWNFCNLFTALASKQKCTILPPCTIMPEFTMTPLSWGITHRNFFFIVITACLKLGIHTNNPTVKWEYDHKLHRQLFHCSESVFLGTAWLRRISTRTKWPPFRRRYFPRHFSEWKVLYFDQNFTEICSQGSNWMVPTDVEKCLNLMTVLKNAWFFNLPWKLTIFLEKWLKMIFDRLEK